MHFTLKENLFDFAQTNTAISLKSKYEVLNEVSQSKKTREKVKHFNKNNTSFGPDMHVEMVLTNPF